MWFRVLVFVRIESSSWPPIHFTTFVSRVSLYEYPKFLLFSSRTQCLLTLVSSRRASLILGFLSRVAITARPSGLATPSQTENILSASHAFRRADVIFCSRAIETKLVLFSSLRSKNCFLAFGRFQTTFVVLLILPEHFSSGLRD
jgi:hypothetical protein